jgi:hypothetical protein
VRGEVAFDCGKTSDFVIAQLDRAIQYSAADLGANKPAQGLLDAPLEAGHDN